MFWGKILKIVLGKKINKERSFKLALNISELACYMPCKFFIFPIFELLSADYSQIELRIMAHLSQDEVMIEGFLNGIDVHTQTASVVFDIFPTMVTDEMRRKAKAINFGIIYGISPFGLAKQIGISQLKAKDSRGKS